MNGLICSVVFLLYLMCQKYFLKLYISGNTFRSRKAIANLRAFCHSKSIPESAIKIVDIMQAPEIAETHKILITPTLVKELPLPQEKIIGDLSNTEILALVFDLPVQPPKH